MTDASLGILPIALIAGLVLVGATVSSVLVNNQTQTANSYQKLVTDVTNDLTTYLSVDQIIGKFDTTNGPPSIQHLAIHLRPLTTCAIDLSKLKIELITQKDLTILTYQDQDRFEPTGSLFNNPTWDHLQYGTFTMLTINDDDASIQTSRTLNKNTDSGFLLITLPKELTLYPYDTCQLAILPTPGQAQWFTLDIPYSTNSPVILYG